MNMSPPVRRLVMVGAYYVDSILSVPYFPREDHKLRATTLQKRRGGNVANALEVLQQFTDLRDVELILLCIVPARSSPATKFIRGSLGPKVNMDYCIYRDDHQEPASCYIIKADNNGSRTIVNYNELPEMTVEEFKEQITKLTRNKRTWFHFEGRESKVSTECLQWAKSEQPNCIRSVEAERPNRPGLEEMVQEADVVFYSKTWAEAAGFNSAEALLKKQGAAALTPSSGSLHKALPRPAPDEKVVDTIGAGDTFTAGVLYKLLASDSIVDRAEEAVEFANELAGRKVLQTGFSSLGS